MLKIAANLRWLNRFGSKSSSAYNFYTNEAKRVIFSLMYREFFQKYNYKKNLNVILLDFLQKSFV